MKRAILCGALLCALTFSLPAQQVEQKRYSDSQKAYLNISAHEIYSFVQELSSSKYAGRLSGSPEFAACAQWAANNFSAWGLLPHGDNGYYFQNFQVPFTKILGPGVLRVKGEDFNAKYVAGKDYYVGTHTATGLYKGSVVYVGYGITSQELKYDDYSGIDVKGKVVMIEPGGPNDTIYMGTVAKLDNAFSHGAAGALVLGLSSHPAIHYHDGFVYCHINDIVANDLLKETGFTAGSLRKEIGKTLKPHSFEIKGRELEMEFTSQNSPLSQTQNIIGYIPGTDKKFDDSPIIVGAHIDHLGNPGGVMFPGALDNASGSAIVLEVAKAFAQSGIKPVRPVVFILFGAEEWSMVGSKFYVQHPEFPLGKTLCMFNLDMVGNGMSLRVSGVDSFPSLKKIIEDENNAKIGRNLYTSAYEKASGNMYTDGEIFSFNDVYAFSWGTRDKLNRTYYHVPEDTVETLTPEIMSDVARLLYLTLSEMSCDKNFKLERHE